VAKKGLGKGLDVLIGSAAVMEGQRLEEIPVKDVKPNPRQPRRTFDKESLEQMARSIEVFGVVQPIVVRTVGTDYELVAGERRWRAAQEAGLEKIPAVIKQTTETDSLEMALIENLHRTDLNGIEEATAYQQLLDDFAITHEELSKRLGKSRTTISNTIRLLQLPSHIQKEVIDGRITTGHARALLALQDKPEEQDRMLARIIEEGLSVREAEGGTVPVEAEEKHPRVPRDKQALPQEVVGILSSLAEILDARVKGSLGKRKGKLIIEFRDMKDLRRIYENILGPWEAGEDSTVVQSGNDDSSGPGLQAADRSSNAETGSPAGIDKGAGDPFWTAPDSQGGKPG
jgi:ParB family transcriptional regulator, chromosome partitioning protein